MYPLLIALIAVYLLVAKEVKITKNRTLKNPKTKYAAGIMLLFVLVIQPIVGMYESNEFTTNTPMDVLYGALFLVYIIVPFYFAEKNKK